MFQWNYDMFLEILLRMEIIWKTCMKESLGNWIDYFVKTKIPENIVENLNLLVRGWFLTKSLQTNELTTKWVWIFDLQNRQASKIAFQKQNISCSFFYSATFWGMKLVAKFPLHLVQYRQEVHLLITVYMDQNKVSLSKGSVEISPGEIKLSHGC